MEGLSSAKDVQRITPDQAAVSILRILGDGVFGNLAGAEPTEEEKIADEKRKRRRRVAKRIHAERKPLPDNDGRPCQVGQSIHGGNG